MSKAVLVLDKMPTSCWDCPLRHDGIWEHCVPAYHMGLAKRMDCQTTEVDDNERLPFCPIRPLPKQANHPDFCDNGRYDKGWNACLDAIERSGGDA